VEWCLNRAVVPNSSSSQFFIGVTSAATLGPKLDVPLVTLREALPPNSITAAGSVSLSTDCAAVIPEQKSENVARTSMRWRNTEPVYTKLLGSADSAPFLHCECDNAEMVSVTLSPDKNALRQIRRVQALTIVWMSVEAAVSLVAAWMAHRLATCIKLITASLRYERFCDGHLGDVIKSGHIAAILRRLKQLADAHLEKMKVD